MEGMGKKLPSCSSLLLELPQLKFSETSVELGLMGQHQFY